MHNRAPWFVIAICFVSAALPALSQVPLRGSGLASVVDPVYGNAVRECYIGADQHVHELFLSGGVWQDADLAAIAGGIGVSASSGLASIVDPIYSNAVRNYYAGTDQHVHELFLYGGHWQDADLIAITGGTGPAVGSALISLFDPLYKGVRTDYIGSDQHVHELFLSGGIWQNADLTAITGAVGVSTANGLASVVDPLYKGVRTDFIATDQHIHELFLWEGKWQSADLTSAAGGTAISVSSSLVSIIDPNYNNAVREYYIGADQHVRELFLSGGKWSDGDLFAIAPGPNVALGSALASVFDPLYKGVRTDYIAIDQHVHELFLWAGTWQSADLTSATGGPLALAPPSSYTFTTGKFTLTQGGFVNFGSLVLAMQSDGNLVLYQNGAIAWNTGTAGQNCGADQCYAYFQPDGNLVVYNGTTPLWNSQTGGNPGAQLVLSGQAPYLTILGSNQSSLWASSMPVLQLANLTHANLTPDFAMGDTFQVTISGAPPNQAVSYSQTPGTTQQAGRTDSNGNFTYSMVEQTANIGSYTQVWSAGSIRISPAISFVVGQLGAGGTVSTTDIGQTSDGSLTGISTISITNETVSTYSATELDATASLYYDAQIVATLYQDGTAILQGVSPITANAAGGTMSASAIAWDDYDLQTDHYAVAFFISGSYFENPLYLGDGSCDDATSDCTIGLGGGVYWLEAASIYVGSTLADQSSVPTGAVLPNFNVSTYNDFLAGANPPYPSNTTFTADVTEWIKAIGAAYIPIKLIYDADNNSNSSNSSSYPPIPFYVDLVTDEYNMGTATRERTFVIRDLYGRPWNMNYPLRIRERFTDMTTAGGAVAPVPNGTWSILVSPDSTTPNDVEIKDSPQFTDLHRGTPLNLAAQANYLEYYYATNFTLPPSSLGLTPYFFGAPGVSGPAMPLWIRDTLNKCSPLPWLPAEGISTSGQYVYIDGDNGPGTGCRK